LIELRPPVRRPLSTIIEPSHLQIHLIVLTDIAEECHCFSLAAVFERSTPVVSTFVCAVSARFNQLNAM
jgi:hypothetical protein